MPKNILRLSEKLQKMCTKLESEIEAAEMSGDSKITLDQIRERLTKKNWATEEIESLISKYENFNFNFFLFLGFFLDSMDSFVSWR